MNIVGLPALVDSYENYIWLLRDRQKAWVLDPGEAAPVINYLQQHQLTLQGILITHRHPDHVAGIEPLLNWAEHHLQHQQEIIVYGPKLCEHKSISQHLSEGDTVGLTSDFQLKVLDTPGHTDDHISYYNDQALFCGDTLFSGGCGRILGGTIEQFSSSILKLRQLDDNIGFYSAHEYTNTNLSFAKLVEPNNAELLQRIASTDIHYPSILTTPQSTLGEEKATNPFLRFDNGHIKAELIKRGAQDNAASLFKTLRAWKDDFDRNH